MWAWGFALFFLGVIAGGLLWVPMVIKQQREECATRMRLASRYRDAGDVRHDAPRSGQGR